MLTLWPREARSDLDPQTGAEVHRLTDHPEGVSHHLYFTNEGVFDEGRRLLFVSDRSGSPDLYSVDLKSGPIVRHSTLPALPPGHRIDAITTSLAPDGRTAFAWRRSELHAVDLVSGAARILTRLEPGEESSMTSCTADGRFVCFATVERPPSLPRGRPESFRALFSLRPQGTISRVPVEGGRREILHQERAWLGHANASPTQAHLLTFCHEGPWSEVDHRIWVLDQRSGRVHPVRPRRCPGERVGHEYWLADGLRIGFHGSRPDGASFFGWVWADGRAGAEATGSYGAHHTHSLDFDFVVGDHGGLVLWRREGDRFAGPRLLCRHGCSESGQRLHVHPRFTPDGRSVVFTTDRTGLGQVHLVPLPPWEHLPEVPPAPSL